jgi:hypothetical protein
MKAEWWSRMMSAARRDASLCAYETALRWLQTYPAHEVERRLVEMIASKREAAQRASAQSEAG